MKAYTEYLVGDEIVKVPRQVPFEGSFKNSRGRSTYSVERTMREKPQATMIAANTSWLVCTCWCEAEFIGIPQVEVMHGITRSCGLSKCNNPDTHEQVIGNKVRNGITVLDALFTDKRPARALPAMMAGTRAKARSVKRPAPKREDPEIVQLRRDLVAMLFITNKRPIDIAQDLNIPLYTVRHDIDWLRVKKVL